MSIQVMDFELARPHAKVAKPEKGSAAYGGFGGGMMGGSMMVQMMMGRMGGMRGMSGYGGRASEMAMGNDRRWVR